MPNYFKLLLDVLLSDESPSLTDNQAVQLVQQKYPKATRDNILKTLNKYVASGQYQKKNGVFSANPPADPSGASDTKTESSSEPERPIGFVSAHQITIVSWNILSSTMDPWKHSILKTFVAMDPDLIMLQEVGGEIGKWATYLPNHTWIQAGDEHAFFLSKKLKRLARYTVESPLLGPLVFNGASRSDGPRKPQGIIIRDERFRNMQTFTCISVHAPTAKARNHPSFIKQMLEDDLRSFINASSVFSTAKLKAIPIFMGGDFNENISLIQKPSIRSAWVMTGDEYTKTSNTQGFDFFAVSKRTQALATFHQHELTQRQRKNTTLSQDGASNHDPIILTVRERGY